MSSDRPAFMPVLQRVLAGLGRAGSALIYAGVLAAAGAFFLGMIGAAVTIDFDALLHGFGFMVTGVVVEAPLVGIVIGLLALAVLVVSKPLHRWPLGDAAIAAAVIGLVVMLGWCLVQLLLAGLEMSWWPGLVGAILGAAIPLLGAAAGFPGKTDRPVGDAQVPNRHANHDFDPSVDLLDDDD